MTHRYIARIILEAETPLFMGSGEASLLTDALVQRDAYGFPMIQGTSLAGVLRHALEDNCVEEDKKKEWRKFFGYQEKKKDKGQGSKVRISSAYLLLKDGKIADLDNWEELQSEFRFFENLPVRQHVRITHRGTALDSGLFDNEVVYKGVRFVFEVELRGDEKDGKLWNLFLEQLKNPLFRLGAGTRKGYGKMKILSCKTKIFDLAGNDADFEAYLNYDPSFNVKNSVLSECENLGNESDPNIIEYTLKLTPDDFFIFGAGYGDEEVDNVPVKEKVVEYDDEIYGTLSLSQEEYVLIPGTSIKGALAHRTAFHYNRFVNRYVDELAKNANMDDVRKLCTGVGNKAVYDLFGVEEGCEWSVSDEKAMAEISSQRDAEFSREGRRGNVLIEDIFFKDGVEIKSDKIFNHVAIDRFTGGAMDGVLFSEKVCYFESEPKPLQINIMVLNQKRESNEVKAFEEALKDVCRGLLPLGGMTTKGHGMFTGELSVNGVVEFSYE